MDGMKIAIQGSTGSFHHLAALRWFGESIEIVPCETFLGVFQALADLEADHAICAVENSLYGSINEVYDLLLAFKYPIVGELPEHIHQQLIGLPGADVSQISRVYSHPVALNQCREFLAEHLPAAEKIEYHDTAEAVALIKQLDNPTYAAIAGHAAAAHHGMQILQENIEDERTNFTRFLILDPSASEVAGANKASLILRTSHAPGALYRALGVFANLGINLTKLHSRPIRGQVWKYQFFIDIEADQRQLDIALSELSGLGCEVTVLGHYKAAEEIEVH